jgi:hypothetical protein
VEEVGGGCWMEDVGEGCWRRILVKRVC